MRILIEDTAAVVIDIQERLLPHIHNGDQIMANCIRLIEGLKVLAVPLMITQQYTKGLGLTVKPVSELMPDVARIEKISFSCCDEPLFMEELIKTDKNKIVICGIEAHVCVLQTCLDLLAQGMLPVVVEDCVSSRRPDDKRIAIERLRQEGAVITSYESILFELTRQAGTHIFKSISGIVK
jgi:nicotinamidase-related amidase